jgi:hypothetical protein
MTDEGITQIRLRTNVVVDFKTFVGVYKQLREAFNQGNLGLVLTADEIRAGSSDICAADLAREAEWLDGNQQVQSDVADIITAALEGERLETTLLPWREVLEPDYPKAMLVAVSLYF